MPSAEDAYEFRHAVTRDAAYQMLLPSERDDLHRHVVRHLHESLAEAERSTMAAEVLSHIDAVDDIAEFDGLELDYLRRAATHARTNYDSTAAAGYLRRVIAHLLADVQTRIEAAKQLGATLLAVGQTEEAAGALGTALEEAREDAPQQIGSLQAGLAGVYMESGRSAEAGELFERAVEACRTNGDEVDLGRALTNRAVLYRHIGKDVDHEALLKEALVVHRRVGNRSSEGLTLMALGGVYRTAEDNDRAEEHYHQALALFRELGDRPLEAQCLGNLANVFLVCKRFDEASNAYVRALRVMRELGRPRSEAILLGNYGQLLESAGRIGSSLAARARAVHLLESMNDLMLLPPFRAMYAGTLALVGRYEDAERQFAKAGEELSGDTNVGALDHVLPSIFRFHLAKAGGGYGPGRDPAHVDATRLDEASRVLKRIRAANTAKSSGLTRVIDRETTAMTQQLNGVRERLSSGGTSGRFNNRDLNGASTLLRKALLSWLTEDHTDQLDWMREHDCKLYQQLSRETETVSEPDWRTTDIPT